MYGEPEPATATQKQSAPQRSTFAYKGDSTLSSSQTPLNETGLMGKLERNNALVAQLHGECLALEQRLDPILTVRPPAAENGKVRPSPIGMMAMVDTQYDSLINLGSRLQELQQRIQL